jgi:amino acid permease
MGVFEIIALSSLLLLIVILNIIASYIVTKTYFEVKNRPFLQHIFIWVVPIIGSFLAIYLNRQDYFYEKFKRPKQIGNNTSITDAEARSHVIASRHFGGR